MSSRRAIAIVRLRALDRETEVMKLDYTHICVVLDASGSMGSIKHSVQKALAQFASEQQKLADQGEKIAVDVYQFDNRVRCLAHDADLSELSRLIEAYECNGGTALYDAVCTGIDELGQFFAGQAESERPEDVVFVIVTDGEENSSRQFSNADVQARIKTQTETYNWKFVFLASDIDAEAAARDIGINDKDGVVAFDRANVRRDFCVCFNRVIEDVREERVARRSK